MSTAVRHDFPSSRQQKSLRKITASMRARISDLSVSGCDVDTINPLPDGTLVQVKIITETQSPCACRLFPHPPRLGLAFREVLPNFIAVLQNWLPTTV
jgi:hypothetical protein